MLSLEGLADLVSATGEAVLVDEHDPEDAAEAIRRAGLRPARILPTGAPPDLRANLTVVPGSGPMTFARLCYGGRARVVPAEPQHDAFLFVISLRGSARFRYGGAQVLAMPGTSGFVAPYREFDSDVAADYDQVVVTMPRERVETIASRLLDSTDIGPVEFDYATDAVHQGAEVLHLMAAAAQLGRGVGSDLRQRIGDVLTEATLLSMPSLRARMDRPHAAHGRAVRTAMEYMRANLAEPLTLADIASRALVSPRALQLAFRREVGQTPMQWLRDRRLDTAHTLLRSADASHLRVTDIAHRAGFLHLGDFAQRFRLRFGETPSALRRRYRDAGDS